MSHENIERARALVEMTKPDSIGRRPSDHDLAQFYASALDAAEARGMNDAGVGPPPDIGLDEPITEDWLKESGFRWAQHHRQNTKHWLLWLGDAVREREGFNLTSYEDIGIEVTQGAMDQKWFCWFRSDAGSLYGRFLHVRHMRLRIELVRLVEAVTGYPWTPEFHVGGSARGPIGYKNMLDYARRKDVELIVDPNRAWHDIERDPYRAGATAQTLRELADREAGKIP